MRFRLLAATLVAALLTSFGATAHAQDHSVEPVRVGGGDRFETAANIAMTAYPDGASVAVLANGLGFADALSSAYVAGLLDAPVLLTMPGQLPAATEEAFNTLEVEEVLLIGGSAAISDGVSQGLIDDGFEIDRVSGPDRYATAAAAALRFGPDPVSTIDGERVALVASGETFPDALAVGPMAFGGNFPLLLGQSDRLGLPTLNTLEQLEIDRLVVIGGEAALPPTSTIETSLEVRVGEVEVTRIAGVNRYATAALVSDFALLELGWSSNHTLLARGDTFPDALAAAALGGSVQAPLLLAESPSTLGSAARGWLNAACPDPVSVRALGGTSAISNDVLNAAVEAAADCEPEEADNDT